MATAKKLPSGSWRALVYSHTEMTKDENGKAKKKRVYESFTSDDSSPRGKREAELEAAKFAADKEKLSKSKKTFGKALDEYIAERKSILSPRTIMSYNRMRKNDLASLSDLKVRDITQETVQDFVNEDTKTHSAKTVRDNHGLIAAVLKRERPEFALNTALPKMVRPDIYVPSDEDVKALMSFASGTVLELPILLAAFGPMRRGEICALDTKNIKGNVVHVSENMVLTPDHTWEIKEPKSYAGNRFIDYPQFVADRWSGVSGRITTLSPDAITNRFARLLKKADIPHFRFHDLRHYCASIQHAIGVPDAYIMQRGGWGNDGVLKNVYRHVMDKKAEEVSKLSNDYFTKMQHEMQHEIK